MRIIWVSALTLVFSAMIGKSINTTGMLFVVPVIVIGLAFLYQRWTNRANISYLVLVVSAFLILWAFSGVFITGIPSAFLKFFSLVVLPLMAVLILYWVRWWVTRSSKFGEGL
jgi:hypothetical protein